MSGRASLLGAMAVAGAAALLHVASCGAADEGEVAADGMARVDDTGAETLGADASRPDAAVDADARADASKDACAACASGYCGDGGCDPVVFMTSKTYAGAIGDGGVVAADEECTRLAGAAGLPGIYRAWLSVGASSPSTRFARKSARPYRRLDGRPVAADFASLQQNLQYPISVTEDRFDLPFSYVWTSTNGDGTAAIGGDCEGWTSADAAVKGGAGESDDTVAEWTSFGEVPCSTMARLYCFEQ